MNINQISCHHFWTDPESTLRSHKLCFITPRKPLLEAGLPTLRSNFLTRDIDDFISPVSKSLKAVSGGAREVVSAYQQTGNLCSRWSLCVMFARTLFGDDRSIIDSVTSCPIIVAFVVCVVCETWKWKFDNGEVKSAVARRKRCQSSAG